MLKWLIDIFKPLICPTCGKEHGDGAVIDYNIAPRDVMFPGHEYVLYTQSDGARPEVWRLGLLSMRDDERDGMMLTFTAAREHQEDDTVTTIIPLYDIVSAREVRIDKSYRHCGRNAVRGSD